MIVNKNKHKFDHSNVNKSKENHSDCIMPMVSVWILLCCALLCHSPLLPLIVLILKLLCIQMLRCIFGFRTETNVTLSFNQIKPNRYDDDDVDDDVGLYHFR